VDNKIYLTYMTYMTYYCHIYDLKIEFNSSIVDLVNYLAKTALKGIFVAYYCL